MLRSEPIMMLHQTGKEGKSARGYKWRNRALSQHRETLSESLKDTRERK